MDPIAYLAVMNAYGMTLFRRRGTTSR
jgi:hypothetical protein